MSRIKALRASIESKLDALEQQALALEAQLTQGKDQAVQRLEQGKQQLREVVTSVQADLRESKELAEHVKADVQATLDYLLVQLALGKADARDAFEEQRKQIFKALNEFETIADQKLTGMAFDSGRLWTSL
jgi:class 3 adenylate cyclase